MPSLSNNPFPTIYEEFIYKSRYSKWLENEGRREEWSETIRRYLSFMNNHLFENYGYELDLNLQEELFVAIHNLEVMPSMRALMTAGEALARDNTCGYNCSYLPVDSIESFDEAMFILMCGTGVGFSVERQYVNKLPEVPQSLVDSDTVIICEDSKEGWARCYRDVITTLYSGRRPKWDLSLLRPAGAKLKTFGGRSSGPEPFDALIRFTISTFEGATGRKLTSLECHDLMCKIGDIVVSGGVRRSAMISLSNLSDDRMRNAKSGIWWDEPANNIFRHGYRALANNSVAYTEKPETGAFLDEWTSIYKSHSGERGIFNRQASKRVAGLNGRRSTDFDFGTNPCSEIILRPYQFCNLTEVVVRSSDTVASLARKVRLATILGTFQSTLTDFPYLRNQWKENTEAERLLGVSLTGIMDCELTNGTQPNLPYTLEALRQVAIDTNRAMADALGIQQSAAITCVKPSGTVSQLVDSASGIHPRYSHYYTRTVRCDNTDPVTKLLKAQGVRWEPDVSKPDRVSIFYFPMKSPEGAKTRDDLSAIKALELWKIYQEHWCEHKPSVTIQVKENEWPSVGGWVFDNFDIVSGISFLPFDSGIYRQAPYTVITKEEYEHDYENSVKEVDWSKLSKYEKEDHTVSMNTLACSADGCEVVDLT